MRVTITCLVSLAACGSGRGGTSTSDSGADTASGELCNGVDDNGDDVIDEGCPCSPFDTSTPGSLYAADIAWAGDRYFVVTKDQGTLEVAPVIDGVIGTSFVAGTVPDTLGSIHKLTWTGTTLAVLLGTSAQTAELALFDIAGTELGRQTLSADTFWNRVTWVGDRFVLTGQAKTFGSPFVLAEFSALGTQLGTQVEIQHPYSLRSVASVATTPSTYVVAAGGIAQTEVFVVDRATNTGAVTDLHTGSQFSEVSAAAVGGQFLVSASGGSSGGLGGDELQFLDAAGVPTRHYNQIYTSLVGMILPDTAGYIGVALVAHNSTQSHFLAVRLDTAGIPIESPVLPLGVTAGTGYSSLDATSAADRVAVTLGDGQSIHVIQHCW